METLSLDYDAARDVLYAKLNGRQAVVGAEVPFTPITISVGPDGRMSGFTIVMFEQGGEHAVPLFSGPVPEPMNIPPGTLRLFLRGHGDIAEIWVDPERTIVAKGLGGTTGQQPLVLDLSQIMVYRSDGNLEPRLRLRSGPPVREA